MFIDIYDCSYCNQYMSSDEDTYSHYARAHNICVPCEIRCGNWEDLKRHCLKKGCQSVCRGCGSSGNIWKHDAYEEHIEDENVCTICEQHFDTPNNLIHHKLVHRDPIYECYRCTCNFRTYSGMIIHLESGACTSGLNIHDLAESAAMCFQWSKFIVSPEARDDYLSKRDVWSFTDEYGDLQKFADFMCPCCGATFTKLSGLFMHVESPACEQGLENGAIGKLRRWLWNRHEWNQ